MHSTDYAIARSLSVRPSHADRPYCVNSKRLKYLQTFFTMHRTLTATPFWFFHTKRYGNIPTGTPNSGVECRGYEKMVIFDQYLASSEKW